MLDVILYVLVTALVLSTLFGTIVVLCIKHDYDTLPEQCDNQLQARIDELEARCTINRVRSTNDPAFMEYLKECEELAWLRVKRAEMGVSNARSD